MNGLIAGALMACYAVAGLFFLRFWSASRDRLFALFALAFGVLAVQRAALSLTAGIEDQTVFYLLRLAAFVIIIVAVIDKNRR